MQGLKLRDKQLENKPGHTPPATVEKAIEAHDEKKKKSLSRRHDEELICASKYTSPVSQLDDCTQECIGS